MKLYEDSVITNFNTFIEISTMCILIKKGLIDRSGHIAVAMNYVPAICRYIESYKCIKYSFTTSGACYDSEGKQYMNIWLK